MGFMTCLLEQQQKDAILVVGDKISKLAKFELIKTTNNNDKHIKSIFWYVGKAQWHAKDIRKWLWWKIHIQNLDFSYEEDWK